MLFIIGTILFWAGSAADIYTSVIARDQGALDYNLFTRDKNKRFLTGRNILYTAILYSISVLVYVAWIHDYQVGASLLLLGAIRGIVALANNYPLYKKLYKRNHP